MNDETNYTVQDLISLSYDQKPIEFGDAFNSLLTDRLAAAVDDRKLEITQTIFASNEQSYEEED